MIQSTIKFIINITSSLFKVIDKIILFQCNRQMEHKKRMRQKRLLASLSKHV